MARKDTQDLPKAKITRESIRESLHIFSYLKPYKWVFVAALAVIALSSLSTMVFPFLIGELVNSVVKPVAEAAQSTVGNGMFKIQGKHLGWNKDTILIFILLQLSVQMVFSYLRIYLLTYVGERALADMRGDVFSKLLQMPMRFFAERRVGELQSRVAADLSQIQDTLTLTLAEFLRGIITLVAGLFMIFIISFKMALLTLAVVPIIAIVGVTFGMKIRKMSRKTQDQLADSGVILQDAFQGITVVKAFTNEGLEKSRYLSAMRKVVQTAISNSRFRGAFISLMIFSIFGTIAVVVWYGTGLMQQGSLDIGELLQFVLFSAFVGGTMAGFADIFTQIQKAIGATQRIREILREQSEPISMERPVNTQRLNGAVKLENVRFSYPTRPEVEVLQGLDFEVYPGQQVAIVGTSGAGKSTLAQLLLQFYKPQSGNIYFDNKNEEHYELSYLRSQMALVPQDVTLFGGTIYENIAYGNPDATEEEIMEAAKKANAHHFISAFPEAYQTIVGERGIKLSGGQRQRVAIARAILKNPAILILDEATSSLDSESEQLVQEALEVLMKGRTSFVIAHRLSTIRNADLILVLDKGRIAESGTHSALMQVPDGIYKKLHLLQAEKDLIQ